MQKPSVFSALKVDGKKLYEYARAGGDIPEVKARPVEVKELELVEWLEPGTHDFKWPEEEVGGEQKVGAEKLIGVKRQRSSSQSAERETVTEPEVKRQRLESEPSMSGALPVGEAGSTEGTTEQGAKVAENGTPTKDVPSEEKVADVYESKEAVSGAEPTPVPKMPQPPAARLRMTVTSGFYVRSLCHDLGLACNSLGLMSSLIRSRQADYELGKNVIEYTDLAAGEEVWAPKIQASLEEFMQKEGWEASKIAPIDVEKLNDKREAMKQEGGNIKSRPYKGKQKHKRGNN
jgi:tRNA pseudouridine55 synthase